MEILMDMDPERDPLFTAIYAIQGLSKAKQSPWDLHGSGKEVLTSVPFEGIFEGFYCRAFV